MNLLTHRSYAPRSHWRRIGPGLLAGWCASLVLPAALAVRPAPDADIDELDARVKHVEKGWEIEVAFEVDIDFDDDDFKGDEFALVLNIQNNGRPIRDEAGKPLEIAVSLDKPSKEDDDELEFKDKLTILLEPQDIKDPRRVSLVARIIRIEDHLTLDKKRIKAKYKDKDDDDDDGDDDDDDDLGRVAVNIDDHHGVVAVDVPYCNLVVRW